MPELYPENGIEVNALLRSERLWVAFKDVERRNEKTGKMEVVRIPVNPRSGWNAKSNKPATWGTKSDAEARRERLAGNAEVRNCGISTMCGPIGQFPGYSLGGVDLDTCRDAETGDLKPWADALVKRFKSYAEPSPSGGGAHVLFVYRDEDLATLRTERLIENVGRKFSPKTGTEIAIFFGGKHLSFTGQPMDEVVEVVGAEPVRLVALDDLRWLLAEHGPDFHRTATSRDADAGSAASERTYSGTRDESGSGHGFRFMVGQAKRDRDHDSALEAILVDGGPAGEWANRATDRELERTWTNAKAKVERDRRALADEFDDYPDDDDEKGKPRSRISHLNDRFAVVRTSSGSYEIAEFTDDEVTLISKDSFALALENKLIEKPAENGKPKMVTADKYFRGHDDRREYRSLVFSPADTVPKDTLNLWRGFGVEPDASQSCDLFLTHLREVICNGNPDDFDYLVRYLAHMVQRPDEKPGVALVLIGGKGVGKDMALQYVGGMFRPDNYRNIAQGRHLLGNFNEHLERALLVHLQEGFWAGSKPDEEILKFLITSPRITIEPKGIRAYEIDSYMRLAITSNNPWVVPASEDERRYFVATCGERRAPEYYAALDHERRNGGPAALMHHLQLVDLTGFNIRQAPETEGLMRQKMASLSGVARWWIERLDDGHIHGASDQDEFTDATGWAVQPQTVSRAELRQNFYEWHQRNEPRRTKPTPDEFGRVLRELCPDIRDVRPRVAGRPERSYQLPALPRCIELAEQKTGVKLADSEDTE